MNSKSEEWSAQCYPYISFLGGFSSRVWVQQQLNTAVALGLAGDGNWGLADKFASRVIL